MVEKMSLKKVISLSILSPLVILFSMLAIMFISGLLGFSDIVSYFLNNSCMIFCFFIILVNVVLWIGYYGFYVRGKKEDKNEQQN